MPDVSKRIFGSWSDSFRTTFALILTLPLVRGWFKLRRRAPQRFDCWRLTSFSRTVHLIRGNLVHVDSFAISFARCYGSALPFHDGCPALLFASQPFLPLIVDRSGRAIARYGNWAVSRLAPLRQLGLWLTLRVLPGSHPLSPNARLVPPAPYTDYFIQSPWIESSIFFPLFRSASFCCQWVQPWPSRLAWPR